MQRSLPLLFLLVACPIENSGDSGGGGDSDTEIVDPGGDPATVPLAGACPLDTHWGEFVVEAYEEYSIVDGQVINGVVPVTILEETLVDGDCTLLRRNNPYCSPTCESGTTCDFDGQCIPYPEGQDLGIANIGGLLESVSMSPVVPGYHYYNTTIPHPPFEAGKLVELSTTGATIEAFTLHGVGVETLEPKALDWTISAGSPLALAWNAPTAVVRSRVEISLNVDQHGLTPQVLRCSFEDVGAAEVPSSVIDELLSAGVTGYPSGQIARRTVDSVTITTTGVGAGMDGSVKSGCVDFAVGHELLVAVEVEGHTPCSSNADCPPGHPCNVEIQTCE